METSIYKDLDAIVSVAMDAAKRHDCNYNVILMNPNEDGTPSEDSTYEYVRDSYFEKERPNVLLLYRTDDLLPKGKTINQILEEQSEVNQFIDKMSDTSMYTRYLESMPDAKDYMWSSQGTYIRETPKIGRNEPCSCGSGKKFKKCCL